MSACNKFCRGCGKCGRIRVGFLPRSATMSPAAEAWARGYEVGFAVACGLLGMVEAIRNRPKFRCKYCKDTGEVQDFSDVYPCTFCQEPGP